jgi:hypothetical protein
MNRAHFAIENPWGIQDFLPRRVRNDKAAGVINGTRGGLTANGV